ncbi:Hypothetical protein I596_1875 [Dokdonella koreensis DS-123]|uniref:Uncharacterized protein n=1 Tax=Dokdonella koreensis DS-123 TaxID=1300342 RepID=A0A160DU02_9GAMM|nr:Hypothetical protein I596_1875 [Dokdonella koreensis DS-123]
MPCCHRHSVAGPMHPPSRCAARRQRPDTAARPCGRSRIVAPVGFPLPLLPQTPKIAHPGRPARARLPFAFRRLS